MRDFGQVTLEASVVKPMAVKFIGELNLTETSVRLSSQAAWHDYLDQEEVFFRGEDWSR